MLCSGIGLLTVSEVQAGLEGPSTPAGSSLTRPGQMKSIYVVHSQIALTPIRDNIIINFFHPQSTKNLCIYVVLPIVCV